MRWRDYDAEPLEMAQAAIEGGTTVEALRRYIRARPYLRQFETEPQWRGSWHDELLIEPIFRLYVSKNMANRSDVEMADRASAAFYLVASLAEEKWNVGTISRPKERLRGMRKRLVALRSREGEFPPQDKKDQILDRIPRGSITELVDAWEHVRPDLWTFSASGQGPPGPSITDYIAAMDWALARMSKRGPKPNRHASEVRERMEADYRWLTGRSKPDWTNANGLGGPFVTFQAQLFASAGIPAPSEHLLRARTKKT
jgi:hypothetical protein